MKLNALNARLDYLHVIEISKYFKDYFLLLELGVPWVTLLSMDSFYKVLNEKEHELAALNQHNFDHPDAFDFELLKQTLQRLKEGKKVEVPIYNFVTHRREAKTTSMYGANVLIFEGILAFHDKVCLSIKNDVIQITPNLTFLRSHYLFLKMMKNLSV